MKKLETLNFDELSIQSEAICSVEPTTGNRPDDDDITYTGITITSSMLV